VRNTQNTKTSSKRPRRTDKNYRKPLLAEAAV